MLNIQPESEFSKKQKELIAKNRVLIITIASILLSPLCGGVIGKITSNFFYIDIYNASFANGLCYIGSFAWIVATIIYYIENRGLGRAK